MNRLMAAAISHRGPDLRVDGVTPLMSWTKLRSPLFSISSPLQSGYFYAPAPGGQRFPVNIEGGIESNPAPLTVVLNWTAGLKT